MADNTCPICYELFTFPKILQCGHTFCFACLKGYMEEMVSQQRELPCPLCRAKCKVPKHGLTQLITNYFAGPSRKGRCCDKCRKSTISSFCTVCLASLCVNCFKTHNHSSTKITFIKDEKLQDDSLPDIVHVPGNLSLQDIPTTYICRIQKQFVIETSSTPGRQFIHALYLTRLGYIYVVPCDVFYVLKLDKNGRVMERNFTPYLCFDILETRNGSLLGSFLYIKQILRYFDGGWIYFSSCLDFFPTSFAELSNDNIVVCGPDHLESTSDFSLTRKTGHLQVLSNTGIPIVRLDFSIRNVVDFKFPHRVACNKQTKTIAVADQETNYVILVQETGLVVSVYNGTKETSANGNRFHPMGLYCNNKGVFLIPSAENVLHILTYSGKTCGIAVADFEDGFGRDVIQDKNGVIWCSDSSNGTIRTIKIVEIKNNLGFNNDSGNVSRNFSTNLLI